MYLLVFRKYDVQGRPVDRERVLITERKKLQAVQRKLAEGSYVRAEDVERIAARLCILLTQEYKV